MASLGHLAVGAAIGAAYSRQTGTNPLASAIVFAGLALAPDLDLVSSLLGVDSSSPLAHRGLTHSVTFALLTGVLAGGLLPGSTLRRCLTGGFVFAALMSHGLLDTMSFRGGGPMLLWPLSNAAYELAWRPIPGVQSSSQYLTLEAVPTFVVETLLFLPFTAYAIAVVFPRLNRAKPEPYEAASSDA